MFQDQLSEEEMRRRKYRNLVRNSERQWLLQIQMKQMQSDNPYVDDYYFNRFQQENRTFAPSVAAVALPSLRRKQRHGVSALPTHAPFCLVLLFLSLFPCAEAPVPLILPSDSVLRLNHDKEYVPRIDGENALGLGTRGMLAFLHA